jgi:hypothetical protein
MGAAMTSWLCIDPIFTPSAPLMQNAVLLIEHCLLGGLWNLWSHPTKTFDFGNWKMVVLMFAYFAAIWLVFGINTWLGFYKKDFGKWLHVHIAWSASVFFFIFFSYVNPIASPQITGMTAAVLSILGLLAVRHFRVRFDLFLRREVVTDEQNSSQRDGESKPLLRLNVVNVHNVVDMHNVVDVHNVVDLSWRRCTTCCTTRW